MRYLITGKNGQLARAFSNRLGGAGAELRALDRSSLDITDARQVREAVSAFRPSVILNCAAYNLVDDAEKERDKALAVNAVGPQNLARAAKEAGAVIVHFSTDYVFDGAKENGPYTESDLVNPLNQYGRTKLAGEQLVRKEAGDHLILRVSWLYGEGRQNFIHRLLEWSKNREYLRAACDEFSVPTHTETVVDVVLKALDRGLRGTHHLANSGFCSRYEWAKLILETKGIKKFIRPVPVAVFNLPAQRPGFSAMDNAGISKTLGITIPAWDESVTGFITSGQSV